MTDAQDLISRKAALSAIEPLLTALLDMTITGSSLLESDVNPIPDAIRALPSVGVTVNPLEWVYHGIVAATWGASAPFGYYVVVDLGENWTTDRVVVRLGNERIDDFDTIEAAKAAAQADYEARILAAIDVQPAPDALARKGGA